MKNIENRLYWQTFSAIENKLVQTIFTRNYENNSWILITKIDETMTNTIGESVFDTLSIMLETDYAQYTSHNI